MKSHLQTFWSYYHILDPVQTNFCSLRWGLPAMSLLKCSEVCQCFAGIPRNSGFTQRGAEVLSSVWCLVHPDWHSKQRMGRMTLNSCANFMQIASLEKQLHRTHWAPWNQVAVVRREVLDMPSIHSHLWVDRNLSVKFLRWKILFGLNDMFCSSGKT